MEDKEDPPRSQEVLRKDKEKEDKNQDLKRRMTQRKIPPQNMAGKAVIGRKIEEAEGRKEEIKNLPPVKKENEITCIQQYMA